MIREIYSKIFNNLHTIFLSIIKITQIHYQIKDKSSHFFLHLSHVHRRYNFLIKSCVFKALSKMDGRGMEEENLKIVEIKHNINSLFADHYFVFGSEV